MEGQHCLCTEYLSGSGVALKSCRLPGGKNLKAVLGLAPMPWPAPLGPGVRGQRCGLEQTSLPLSGSAECAVLAEGVRPSCYAFQRAGIPGLETIPCALPCPPSRASCRDPGSPASDPPPPTPNPRALLTGRGVASAGRRPAGSELRGWSLLQPSPGPGLRGAGQGGARGGARAAAAASERCSRCPQAQTQLESRRLAPAAPLLGWGCRAMADKEAGGGDTGPRGERGARGPVTAAGAAVVWEE